jgi:very-short-patch-repair endonuclease
MQCSNITSNNQWCSICKNKTEQKLFDNLKIIYPSLIHQYKVEWCKNKTFLPFDFVLEEYNIIIELDGKQHFIQVKNWNSPEETHETDKYKMKCANDNKFSVIRILQEDVYYDTFNWLDELKDNIEKIKNENIIQNIFICKNNEYDIFNTK